MPLKKSQRFLWFLQTFFEIFLCCLKFDLVRSPSFDYSTQAVNHLIADGINDQHSVFTFPNFTLVIQ